MNDQQPIHLCIGAARTGTTWLYEVLKESNAIFVPSVKEVRYWWERRKPDVARDVGERRRENCGDDPEQHAWLDRWVEAGGGDADDYRRLMTHPRLPSIDISPGYTKMPDRVFPELSKALTDKSRIMMIVRNPYDRSCSAIKLHAFVHGRARGPLPDDAVAAFLESYNQRVIRGYARVIRRWSNAFPDRFRVFDYADLKADPAEYLKQVAGFLELDLNAQDVSQAVIDKTFNSSLKAKNNGVPPSLTQSQRRLVAEVSLADARAYEEVDPILSARWVQEIEAALETLEAPTPAASTLDGDKAFILRITESLGGTTTFARLQRHFGYEPRSLLRWSSAPLSAALSVVEDPNVSIDADAFDNSEANAVAAHDMPQTPTGDEAEGLLKRTFFTNLRQKPCLYVFAHRDPFDGQGAALLTALRSRNPKHALLELTDGTTVSTNRVAAGHFQVTMPLSSPDNAAFAALLDALANEAEIKDIAEKLFT